MHTLSEKSEKTRQPEKPEKIRKKPRLKNPNFIGLVWFRDLKIRHIWFGLVFTKSEPTWSCSPYFFDLYLLFDLKKISAYKHFFGVFGLNYLSNV